MEQPWSLQPWGIKNTIYSYFRKWNQNLPSTRRSRSSRIAPLTLDLLPSRWFNVLLCTQFFLWQKSEGAPQTTFFSSLFLRRPCLFRTLCKLLSQTLTRVFANRVWTSTDILIMQNKNMATEFVTKSHNKAIEFVGNEVDMYTIIEMLQNCFELGVSKLTR